MKHYEILDKGNSRHVLTISPSRVTIKLQKSTSDEERERIITFFMWISNQPEFSEMTVTFRGRTDVNPSRPNAPLIIVMYNDSHSLTGTYVESEMYS